MNLNYFEIICRSYLQFTNFIIFQGNENYTGIAARDTANALRVLTNAVRGVAACSGDPEVQNAIVESTQDVMIKSALLIEEAKKTLEDPNNPENNQKLAQVRLFEKISEIQNTGVVEYCFFLFVKKTAV